MKPTSIHEITSGIAPYTGAWTRAEVQHLVRRTMFGTKQSDVNYFMTRTLSQAVDELLVAPTAPTPPINNYNTTGSIDPTVAAGATWVNGPDSPNYNFQRRQSLRAWWTGLQINQSRSIQEKMVLFWHNHFSIQYEVVGSALQCYEYNALIRTNSLGNLKTLTRAITVSSAMLKYLNGKLNSKNSPDENYARELQELFTIGKELAVHYTEADVQAAAKVLTGWRSNTTSTTVWFDPTKHDTANKTFSSFYNNTVITGDSSATGGDTELNALMNMIFAQNEVANYIVRRLYRFFVYYKITPDIEQNVIQPLANIYRQNNYNILPVLSTLFKSEHFYDVMEIGCVIKSPVDFTVGYIRKFEVPFPASTDYVTQYYMWLQAWYAATNQQQSIGDPTSVAGWPAYYQMPAFHEIWITADGLRQRKGICDYLMYGGIVKNGFTTAVNPITFAQNNISNPSDPNILVDECLVLMLPLGVSATTRAYLKSILLSFQTQDSYWTTAWVNYINLPSASNAAIIKQRLQYFFSYIYGLAEYQLS